MLMHVGQPEHSLVYNALNMVLRKWLRAVLHELIDVLLHVLKHKVEVVVNPDYFLKLDYLCVVQLAQGLDLTQRHALFPRVEFFLHLLDSHLFFGLNVYGLDD